MSAPYLPKAQAPPRAVSTPVLPEAPRATRFRWVICALLFVATTINYLDRQVLGILAPTLEDEIGWTESQYGFIVAAFQFAYAFGLLGFGHLADRLGTKLGYMLAVVWWSLAAMSHALARAPVGFAAARFALGLGEAGNFPTAIKTVAEWFPRKERALATGIFNGGANIGAVVAPLVVPWLTLSYGWQSAFTVTGAVGFLWVICWAILYRPPARHPRVSASELAHIESDPAEALHPVAWKSLLPHRQTWAFAVGKAMTDPIWWFYLFWLAKYLDTEFGVKLAGLAAPLVVVYLVSDVGSMAGGWLSSSLIKRGWSVSRGRKTTMLLCALCTTPMLLLSEVDSMWSAVLLIALAAAAHQAWSANLFTTATDMFPKRAVGSVVGIGGFAGAISGMVFASAAGWWLEVSSGSYMPLFFIAGLAYLAALAFIHLLAPRLSPASLHNKVY